MATASSRSWNISVELQPLVCRPLHQPAPAEDLYLFLNDLRRLALVAVLVAGVALPHVAAAQSGDDPGTTTVDDQPAVDVQESAPQVQDEAPAAVPANLAPAIPDFAANRAYLNRLQNVRSSWFAVESAFDNLARQQRLGTIRPSAAQQAAGRYPLLVDAYEQRLYALPVPPQFAHVQQLHVAAAGEFRAAATAASWWLSSGDPGGLRDAQAHFAVFDQLIDQALLELG